MSAKSKLRLQHIEDASKSKDENRISPEATALTAAPETVGLKTNHSNPTGPLLNDEAASSSAVGDLLRRNRLERELSLHDIAQQLRIQRSYLEALEEGDFDSLPGLTYAIGYVRSYAKLLDLDQDTLIADFKAEAKRLQEPTQLSFPSPAPEGKVPGGALVLTGVVLAAFSYGAWYYFSTSDTAVSGLTPGIPDRLAFLLEEPAINAPAEAKDTAGLSRPTAVITDADAPVASKAASTTAQAPKKALQQEQKPEESIADAAPEQDVASVSQNPAQQAGTSAAPAALTAVPAAAPETTASPEIALTSDSGGTNNSGGDELPLAPSDVTTDTAPEPAVETTAQADASTADVSTPDVNTAEDAAVADQVASLPEPTSSSATIEIPAVPAVPEVPLREETVTSRSVAEAEAAGIDSKPKPVSTASEPLIVISATDDSWVQVRGTDSSPLLTRILRKGEQYRVPARTGLKLFTGNAGALKISVNGAEAPSLGPFGKIARNIPLDETLLTHTIAD